MQEVKNYLIQHNLEFINKNQEEVFFSHIKEFNLRMESDSQLSFEISNEIISQLNDQDFYYVNEILKCMNFNLEDVERSEKTLLAIHFKFLKEEEDD